MARVAAIGLDAAEWRLVEEWMKEGTLPNLRQLQSESAVFELENVREYRSEAIWGAFAEGRHPSTSGRWTNISFNPEIYQALDTGADKSLPFWSREGATPAVIFDIPHTSTRDDEGVTHVTGWGAHSALFPRASRPVGLLRDIDARYGPHPAFERDNVPSWYDQPYLSRLVEACEQGARTRIEIAKHLMESNPDWKFFVTAMSEPHSVGHHAWHGVDPTHQANKTKHAAFAREAMRVLIPLGVTFDRTVATGGGPDVTPLAQQGVPAFRLNQDGSDYFNWHHTADDVIDRVDARKLDQNVAAWAALLWLIADSDADFRRPAPDARPAAR